MLRPELLTLKDLKPFPTKCYLEYKGHEGPITSITTDSNGQWIASGSIDGSVCVWEVETGRSLKVWDIGEPVRQVAWNPVPGLPLLAVAAGYDLFILNTGLGNEEVLQKIEELLQVETPRAPDTDVPFICWAPDVKYGGIRLKHLKTVSSIEWHRKGDYFSTLMPYDKSGLVLIHQLSKKCTRKVPYKWEGVAVTSAFHPIRPILFISTKKNVRVYDLMQQKRVKKLKPAVHEVSSIAIHSGGDTAIVGSKDGKICWFDMDLSCQPSKVLRTGCKNINRVSFHSSYPLFSSCSDDCETFVFHGKVYPDLNQNPLVFPLRNLHGRDSAGGRGVLDCLFHPRQPWLFTAGADSVIRLYCD